ncbi:MAG TPA: hypothetical protein PKH39_16285 [Woeseiaceae bacterium]|nr:hypothetical protein [Woeseiaceae bacterium]
MRKRKYRDLEKHLYWNGKVYVYRKPDRTIVPLGTNKASANEAARRANAVLYPRDLYHKIMGENMPTVGLILDRFWHEFVVPRYSEKTLPDLKHKAGVIREEWGDLYPDALSVLIVAAFVDRFPPRQSERYAGFLRMFFKWSRSKGFFGENLADDLITRPVSVERQRLSIEGFKAIRACAEPWMQRAMTLALQSLVRREDLALLRFDQYVDGVLAIKALKTGVHIRILVGPELDKAIRNCRDEVASPFMVHKLPTRITKAGKLRREHHTQVLPEQLTRAFSDARKESEFYDELTPGQRPTFHEIRALGAKLYEDAGISPKPLLGHKDDASTKLYLDRHKIEWIDAAGGLKI